MIDAILLLFFFLYLLAIFNMAKLYGVPHVGQILLPKEHVSLDKGNYFLIGVVDYS
jgi:hypothetical protein